MKVGFYNRMPTQETTTYQFFWRDRTVHGDFRAGVSLHSHTMYSEESLEMLPRYTGHVPIVRHALDANVAYDRAFWTPPLTPRQAHRLEEKQIQRQFQLPGLVSLTDHDNIQAGTLLHVLERFRSAPVSTEWTIPFGPTFFHLGAHNLPSSEAAGILAQLQAFTADPNPDALAAKLDLLNAYSDVLLVLNHPLWDEKGIGTANHSAVLRELLQRHGGRFHALEVNGLRSWKENQQVMRLGSEMDVPVVSGGDRHGREPNAILNLTRGASLVEFIHEVRYQRRSHVVFMPQYHESLNLRTMQTVIDILRDYPESFQGRRLWTQRVFYRHPGATAPVPLSSIWPEDGAPTIFKIVNFAVKFAQLRGVRSMLRLVFDDRTAVWGNPNAPASIFPSLEMDREAAV
jgi:hypothetical protein